MTKISSSDVRKVAQLARLEIPENQIETYTEQLEEILSYIDQLQEIDTENVPPTTRAVEVVNAMREDLVCLLYTSPSPRDATLSRMPSSA